MWVVIFRAQVRQLDDDYGRTAQRMRELALTQFGCLAFHAVTEGSEEVALSYWPDPASIAAWRAHPEHLEAQRLGRERWYRFTPRWVSADDGRPLLMSILADVTAEHQAREQEQQPEGQHHGDRLPEPRVCRDHGCREQHPGDG